MNLREAIIGCVLLSSSEIGCEQKPRSRVMEVGEMCRQEALAAQKVVEDFVAVAGSRVGSWDHTYSSTERECLERNGVLPKSK